MASLTTLRRRIRSEYGAELIEMAMVTPILLLLVGGIVDFGFVFRSWQIVTNAAREGARVGVLPGYACDDTAGGDVESRVSAYLSTAGLSGATVNAATTTVNGLTSCGVTVTYHQPLPSLSVFGQFFGGAFSSVSVAGGASMRTETQSN